MRSVKISQPLRAIGIENCLDNSLGNSLGNRQGFRLAAGIGRSFLIGWALMTATIGYAALPKGLEQDIRVFVAKNPMIATMQVEIEYLDPDPVLQSCPEKINISLQPGIRLWGRTSILLKCNKLAWSYNLMIKIKVLGDYAVANRYLQFGTKLVQGDLRIVRGDLTEVPDDVLRNVKDAFTKTVMRPIQTGMPIGLNDLKESAVINRGDFVRVRVIGKDFEVSGDGIAQVAGIIGDTIAVKLLDGQTISGKVKGPGQVELITQ